MILMFSAIIVFSFCYLLKGGQFNKYIEKLPSLIGGKFLSALTIFIFCAAVSSDWVHGLIFCAAWALAVAPSMGEEAGAIGRWGHAWGRYIDWMPSLKTYEVPKIFANNVAEYPDGHERYFFSYRSGRSYGILKGVQRGAWMGAVFTVAGATSQFIMGQPIDISTVLPIPIMALGFPLAHFIGQEIYYRINKTDDWKYSEAIVGALLGLCYALARGV